VLGWKSVGRRLALCFNGSLLPVQQYLPYTTHYSRNSDGSAGDAHLFIPSSLSAPRSITAPGRELKPLRLGIAAFRPEKREKRKRILMMEGLHKWNEHPKDSWLVFDEVDD
jgi:hypothetical protein